MLRLAISGRIIRMMFSFALVSVIGAHPTFDEWAAMQGINGGSEEMRANYQQTLLRIAEYESELGQTATFSVNQFSGMSWEEFSQTMLSSHVGNAAWSDLPMLEYVDGAAQEDEIDWDVTPVKNQGGCGSCWAFGAMGAIEAKHKQQTGETVQLAEQQLLDCDKKVSCDGSGLTTCDSHCNCGCDGGQADWAYAHYLANAPLYTMASYPYKGRNGQCQTGIDSGIRLIGFVGVESGSGSQVMTDADLAAAVMQGIVEVAVGADGQFTSYSSGILTRVTTSCSLNHEVVVTGYGQNYWKIKNSWGASWGEGGFIRFERSTAGCGPFGMLSFHGVVPTLSSSAQVEV